MKPLTQSVSKTDR